MCRGVLVSGAQELGRWRWMVLQSGERLTGAGTLGQLDVGIGSWGLRAQSRLETPASGGNDAVTQEGEGWQEAKGSSVEVQGTGNQRRFDRGNGCECVYVCATHVCCACACVQEFMCACVRYLGVYVQISM